VEGLHAKCLLLTSGYADQLVATEWPEKEQSPNLEGDVTVSFILEDVSQPFVPEIGMGS
jgi:hypothetical protein